jgi:hypothetical protein
MRCGKYRKGERACHRLLRACTRHPRTVLRSARRIVSKRAERYLGLSGERDTRHFEGPDYPDASGRSGSHLAWHIEVASPLQDLGRNGEREAQAAQMHGILADAAHEQSQRGAPGGVRLVEQLGRAGLRAYGLRRMIGNRNRDHASTASMESPRPARRHSHGLGR